MYSHFKATKRQIHGVVFLKHCLMLTQCLCSFLYTDLLKCKMVKKIGWSLKFLMNKIIDLCRLVKKDKTRSYHVCNGISGKDSSICFIQEHF